MESRCVLRGLFALATVLATAAAAPCARADGDADRATARRLAEEGDDAMATGRYAAAIDAYSQAYSIVPAPTLKLAIGNVEYAQHHLIEAQRAYADAAHGAARSDDPPAWITARLEASQKVDAITPRLPMLTFNPIGLAAASVHVKIDDTDVPSADVPRAVNPGRHTIVASASGYLPDTVIVSIGEGERKAVDLRLGLAPQGPRRTDPLTPVAAQGGSTAPWNALTIGGAIATGVFTGVGIATGALSNQKVNDLSTKYCMGNHCENSTAAKDDRDAAKRLGDVATASFVLAGASAVFTGFTIYENRKAQRETTLASLRVHVTTQEVRVLGQF